VVKPYRDNHKMIIFWQIHSRVAIFWFASSLNTVSLLVLHLNFNFDFQNCFPTDCLLNSGYITLFNSSLLIVIHVCLIHFVIGNQWHAEEGTQAAVEWHSER